MVSPPSAGEINNRFGELTMDGMLCCSRYAFGPNRLHLCGPDMNTEVAAYLAAGASDPGLEGMLSKFRTLYPYLQTIAQANGITDPFDERVVEAYWVGNALLETIPVRTYHRHLVDKLALKKRYPFAAFRTVEEKLKAGARMHHNFHVFNLYKRTGHVEIPHTLESIDKCRVSWGKIVAIDGPTVRLERQPIVAVGHGLGLGLPAVVELRRSLTADDVFETATVGDVVSLHWDAPCEILSAKQLRALKQYTAFSLALTNVTA